MAKAQRFLIAAMLTFFATKVDSGEILLPFVMSEGTNGTGGTFWKTQLYIWNESDQYWPNVWPTTGCTFDNPVSAPPRETSGNIVCVPSNTGAVLSVPAEIEELITIHLSLRNAAASPRDAGIAVPVVRERDFFTGTSTVMNVPADERDRRTVRVYTLDSDNSMSFTLAVFIVNEEEAFWEGRFTVPPRTSRWLPSELRLNDQDGPDYLHFDSIKYRLTPDDSSAAYWWLVSSVSNENQAVRFHVPMSPAGANACGSQ